MQKRCSDKTHTHPLFSKNVPSKKTFEEFTYRKIMKIPDYTMNRLRPNLFGVYSPDIDNNKVALRK